MEYSYKKQFGQHFLQDKGYQLQIINLLDTSMPNWLEVGPGAGAITSLLLKLPIVNFKAVEIDKEKVDYLLKNFPAIKDKLIHDDFLKITPIFDAPFNIIGNFPYNISTQIIFKILDMYPTVPFVIGMFQKEVAQRFAAKHGNKTYGITSVITQCYYDIKYEFDVPPEAFVPPPKIVSGVITLKANGNPFGIKNYIQFKKFVKAAFSQRRKTLRNALKQYLPQEVLVDDIFNKRAEQLDIATFVDLYKKLYTDA